MNYEKLYKDALQRAKHALDCDRNNLVSTDVPLIYSMFPELKGNEEERIKKDIISYLKNEKVVKRYISDIEVDKWIAWLEKQGEQKSAESTKDYNDIDPHFGILVEDLMSTDKTEPKFKVGNWYQCSKDFFGKGVTFDKNTAYYCAKEGCLQNEYGCHIAIDKNLHDNFKLWTIEDAKDGDILVDKDNNIGLYSGEMDDSDWHSCIYLGCDGYLHGGSRIGGYHNNKNTKPATKEQCYLLFQKMKEAGYEWDNEKKELKKIEVVSKENEDERIRKELCDFLRDNMLHQDAQYFISWLEKQGKQESIDYNEELKKCRENPLYFIDKYVKFEERTPAWSKEDEEVRKALISILKSDFEKDTTIFGISVEQIITWLEKQGEKINPYSGTSFEYNGHIWGMCARDNGVDILLDKQLFKHLEKQGEQKSADKPKFKVGDWFVNNNRKDVFLIKSINTNGYCTLEDIKGNIISPCLPPCESDSHLWTIEDAKDGDVLINWNNTIFIFKAIEDEAVKFHIAYNERLNTIATPLTKLSHQGLAEFEFRPATKEQCDLLFQKMKEAGYEWASEKKELKKIKQKPADKPKFKVGDWIIFNGLVLHIDEIVNGYYRTTSRGDGIHNSYDWDIDNVARLWTIEDAKDGDVLTNGEFIVIFKQIVEPKYRQHIEAYIGLDLGGNIQITSESWSLGIDKAMPATKEQRDLLFQKMKEAGCKWDSTYKKLAVL